MSSGSSNAHFATGPKLGVNLTATVSSNSAAFDLGERVYGTDNTEWVYVQASGAITQYHCVAIDENYQAAAITDALANAEHLVGFAQVAFADNEYGFVALRGSNIKVLVKLSCAADVDLFTTDSAGVLDDASTSSHVKIQGVSIVTAASGTATQSEEVIATYPHHLNA